MPGSLGFLLDVDGPLAHTRTRTIRIPSIAADLAALANAGLPVVFNTGRGDVFLSERVLPALVEHGLRPDAPLWGVCEKGGTWFSLDPEANTPALTPVQADLSLRPPQDLIDACRDLTAEHDDIMDWDGDKRTMISTEQLVEVSNEEYLRAQPGIIKEFDDLIDEAGVTDDFRTGPTLISVDVEHRRTGKALGAQRALELVSARMAVPERWFTAGDSRSDYDMSDWLHAQGFPVTHLDVRPHEGIPDVAYPVIHDAGVEEDEVTARHLAEWRANLGI